MVDTAHNHNKYNNTFSLFNGFKRIINALVLRPKPSLSDGIIAHTVDKGYETIICNENKQTISCGLKNYETITSNTKVMQKCDKKGIITSRACLRIMCLTDISNNALKFLNSRNTGEVFA